MKTERWRWERKTVGGIVNSSLLIRERSRSDRQREREERMDGLWIIICRGGHRKTMRAGSRYFPQPLSSFHSALLIRLWNTVSHEPSSPSGRRYLHYNITFTVITSRTNKTCNWSASQLYWYTHWEMVFFWWRFIGLLLKYMLAILLQGWNGIGPLAVQYAFKSVQ